MTNPTERSAHAAYGDRIAALADHPWRLLIGGDLRPAADGATFTTSDPFTESPLAQVPDATPQDVDAAVDAAAAARAQWRAVPRPNGPRWCCASPT